MKTVKQEVGELLDLATDKALAHVEKLARRILRRNKRLDYFLMAMGDAFFTVKGKEDDNLGLDERKAFKELHEFIEEFDDFLGLTGTPMMFTATGPVVTDW